MEFKKACSNTKNTKIIEYFYRERLCKRLVIGLEDQVEKNREISIDIITEMVEKCGFKEESQIILPAIASRMIKTPFTEPCKLIFSPTSRMFLGTFTIAGNAMYFKKLISFQII
jgi:hypothetical protein